MPFLPLRRLPSGGDEGSGGAAIHFVAGNPEELYSERAIADFDSGDVFSLGTWSRDSSNWQWLTGKLQIKGSGETGAVFFDDGGEYSDIYVDASVKDLKGGYVDLWIYLKYVDENNYFRVGVLDDDNINKRLFYQIKVNGSSSNVLTKTSFYTNDEVYTLRIKTLIVGDTLKAKVWKDGGEEPASWEVDMSEIGESFAGVTGDFRVSATTGGNLDAGAEILSVSLYDPEEWGAEGDVAFDTETGNVYQKVSGSWTQKIALQKQA